ncbi:MAG: hypothetical protein JW718_01530 [Desulfovibrionaceae bacterium]|nr:hypothetical protein [Desulfovibrionaceae bacterium]
MTVIKWGPDQAAAAAQDRRTTGVWTGSAWSERFKDADRAARYARLAPSLALELENRVRALDARLAGFRWPDTGLSMARARLAVKDPGLERKVRAELPEAADVSRYYRYFSRGFEASQPLSLDPGDYEFKVSLGADSETLSLEVGSDWTNGDLLQAVADGINDSKLKVQAEVVRQDSPGQRVDGLLATGSALALTVNQAYADRELKLRDSSGHLVKALDLEATRAPVGPAEEAVYDLKGVMIARPTAFSSKGFDPNEATGLAAGTYGVDFAMGADSGTVRFVVEAADTWRDVLTKLGQALDSAQDSFSSRLVTVSRPSDLVGDDLYLKMDGLALAIEAEAPKVGERLSLGGSDAASDEVLSALGLDCTAYPGSDARMTVNGTDEVRAPGIFSEDQGRVRLGLEDSFGQTLPLRVTGALERLEQGVGGVAAAYNDLRLFMLRNQDLLSPGLAEDWRGPVDSRLAELNWLGLEETGRDRLLWFDHDRFYFALGRDPDRVRDLLSAPGKGLFKDWERAAGELLAAGPESRLVEEASVDDPALGRPGPATELELEKGSRLLDLYDDLPEPGEPHPGGRGGVVDKSG